MKISIGIIVVCLILVFSCKQEKIGTGIKQALPQSEKKFCFIERFYSDGKNFASVDMIEHLKMSDLKPGAVYPQLIELPDKSSYVNKEIKHESFEIDAGVKIIMQTFSRDPEGNYKFRQSISLTDLLNSSSLSGSRKFLNSPFEIELLNNKIISLTEIYIP